MLEEDCWSILELAGGDVHLVSGGTTDILRSKPAGTRYASWIDSTACGILFGMAETGNMYWDLDEGYIDQTTGEPVGVPSGATIILSGGSRVNAVIRYYEDQRISPVYWGHEGSTNYWYENDGTRIDASGLIPTPANDMFVIMIFQDSQSRTIISIYGYGGPGTLAGAIYFKENVETFMGRTGYWIFEWTDSSSEGTINHPDVPGVDSYDPVASSG
jgi:hypothetical protein